MSCNGAKTNCSGNIVVGDGCVDNYVSNVWFDVTDCTLYVQMNGGVVYDAPITCSGQLSNIAGNQLVTLSDGLYVPEPSLSVNTSELTNGETLQITSDDNTISITTTSETDGVKVDLSSHPAMNVSTNAPYSFSYANQTLTIPVPTFTENVDGSVTIDPGTGDAAIVIGGGSGSGDCTTCTLNDLSNVSATNPSNGQLLAWNGTNWIATTFSTSGSMTDNGDGTYTFTGGGSSTDIETATQKKNPFTKQGSAQLTRGDDIAITDAAYRTGNTGFGLTSSNVVQGKVEVRGDEYISSTGSEASQYLQTNAASGSPTTVQKSLNKGATVYQVQTKDTNQMLHAIDEDGNVGFGEVASGMSLPQYTFGSEGNFVMSNYNNESPNLVPVSAYSVTEVVLII